ncbi:hypothetical protein [Acaryochloris sp. IP29b_bin.137]|uniref:hypothetical protein n=1 Tax=Acaryochloris sp. IP29b_bin.137 TaxID=2969217 RepID=UPI002606A9A2|nr:hypothetical protein [Acaryochloris sp. IP29b_bin.137]
MVQPMTSNKLKPGDTTAITLTVEKLQLLSYLSFWIIVMTGIFLTERFSDIDLENTTFQEVIGYNNICIYFDTPPSTYVLPFFWAITLVIFLIYLVANWLQMIRQLKAGHLDQNLYQLLSRLKLFEAFTLVFFSTVFAVSPEGWDHTLFIHTIPFLMVQIGVTSMAISGTLFGIKSGYWERLELAKWFKWANILDCILISLVVVLYIPMLINAMADGIWWAHTDRLSSLAEVLDRCFLFLSAIVPLLNAIYLVCFKSDKIEVVNIAL